MKTNNPAKSKKLSVIVFIGIFFLFIFLTNRWIGQQMQNTSNAAKTLETQRSLESEPVPVPVSKHFENVIRKVWLDPNREYYESVFWADDQEIARYKNKGENIYDVTGTIPDGKVKFENATDKTTGIEYYMDGQKEGPYREYYENGKLKRESEYRYGTIITNKEYFIDGIVRMEEDFSDALVLLGKSQVKEVGVGKIFSREGKLMYEWQVTTAAKGGYNRSFNRNGELMAENYFDENGKLIKSFVRPTYVNESQ